MDLARRIAVAGDHHDLVRRLNHLEVENQHPGRKTAWLAVRRLEIAAALPPLADDRRAFRLEQLLAILDVPEHVNHVLGNVIQVRLNLRQARTHHARNLGQRCALGLPETGKIGYRSRSLCTRSHRHQQGGNHQIRPHTVLLVRG